MASPARYSVTFDTEQILIDASAKGWNRLLLAEAVAFAARQAGQDPPHRATVYRFLADQYQTPRVAKLIATALGKEVSRYIRKRRAGVAA